MDKYKCNGCGYIYDSEKGVGSWEDHIPPNTPFDKLCGSWDRIEPVKGANEVDAPFLTSVMITMENIQRRKEGLQ